MMMSEGGSQKGESQAQKGEPRSQREAGEATVEFLGVLMLFAIPVFYLILCLGVIQSCSYAAEAGARQGARILAIDSGNLPAAREQVALTFHDYGLEDPSEVNAFCVPASCAGENARVTVEVYAEAPLPLLPQWMGSIARVPIGASVSMPVEGVHLH